jgi:hypothetical protein
MKFSPSDVSADTWLTWFVSLLAKLTEKGLQLSTALLERQLLLLELQLLLL